MKELQLHTGSTILKKNTHWSHFVETEINAPSENTFIANQNGTFTFSIGLSCAKLWAFECEQYTIAWEYAYKNCYKAEVLCVRWLWTLEVAHTIQVHVLSIELWTHVT